MIHWTRGDRQVRLNAEAPLYLLRPVLRHASAPLHTGGSGKPNGHGWRQAPSGGWVFDDRRVRLDVSVSPAGPPARAVQVMSVTATALEPVQVGLCALEMCSPAKRAWFLDRHLRWRMLNGSASLNDYSPLVVRWESGPGQWHEMRSHRGFLSCRLSRKRGSLHLTLIIDAAALHPRWQFRAGQQSAAAPLRRPGESMTVHVTLAALHDAPETRPGVLGRSPHGREASFTLTDHCDFDSNERLELFLHGDASKEGGWLGKQLRMTKGVFTLETSASEHPLAASLENPRYGDLIRALERDGSEIAPHSLRESGNLDAATIASALAQCAARWSPRVWIDHGFVPYNYSMGGGDDRDVDLLRRLSEHGFVALSAAHDVPIDPCASLNLLAPSRSWRAVPTAVWRHWRRGRGAIALRYLRAALRRRLVGPVGYVIDGGLMSVSGIVMTWLQTRRLSAAKVSEHAALTRRRAAAVRNGGWRAFRIPYTRQELLDMAAVVYPERGVPLNQARPNEMLLFTTAETLHTKDIYTEHALERLLAERGLHVGHSYLLNVLPYVAGVFDSSKGGVQLSIEWKRFVAALSRAVRLGRLWNPTMTELATYMRGVQQVRVVSGASGQALHLYNDSPEPLADVTVLVPGSVIAAHVRWDGVPPTGAKYWDDWLAIWGTLKPRCWTVVEWHATRPAIRSDHMNTPVCVEANT